MSIDFVVLWVNGNDEEWQRKKAQFSPDKKSDIGINRYREWDNLKYWFRAVEKYAPWVRKIHFVTDHQVPEWLNTSNPKLNCVFHEDYMPKEALPVFNSCAIEIGIHKIEDLSDKFVYFNDDIFLTDYITEKYYFKNNLPKDMAGFIRKVNPKTNFENHLKNDYDLINKYFVKKEVIKKHFFKWFNIGYGKTFVRSCLTYKGKEFHGFVIPHLSTPYLKTDFQKVWEKEKELLSKTQFYKFRKNEDHNHYVFRFWRLCEGSFAPERSKGKYFSLKNERDAQNVKSAIKKRKYPEICINDCVENGDFEKIKEIVNGAFESVLSEKSSFEK